MPSSKARPVPPGAAAVLQRDPAALLLPDGQMAEELQVAAVMRAVQGELRELDGEYKRAVTELRAAGSPLEEEEAHSKLRSVIMQMEQKSAQLAALRRTHTALADRASAVRDELIQTRTALKETAETAAMRLRRIQQLEQAASGASGGGQRAWR
jgi:predicted  nucleic acid-binding Zn-ribbon protein